MAVTAQLVKELREMTGAGMMDCKKALVETDGDIDKAVEVLEKRDFPRLPRRPEELPQKVWFRSLFPTITRLLPSSKLTPRPTLSLRIRSSSSLSIRWQRRLSKRKTLAWTALWKCLTVTRVPLRKF